MPPLYPVAFAVMYTPALARVLAMRCVEQRARDGHVLVADPGRPTRAAFLEELERLGAPAAFVPLHEAPILELRAEEAATFRLLLVDEHCTPPFHGGEVR